MARSTSGPIASLHLCVLLLISLLTFPTDARGDISIPDCAKLGTFDLYKAQEGLAYGDRNNVIGSFFGIPLGEWSSADFAALRDAFRNCRGQDPQFFQRLFPHQRDDSHFKGWIDRLVDDMQEAQPRVAARSAELERAAILSREFREINAKADDTVTSEDIRRLDDISAELGAMQQHGVYENSVPPLSVVQSAVNSKRQMIFAREQRERSGRGIAERQRQLAEQQAAAAAEAEALITKYGDIGPSPEFLRSNFRTYTGLTLSGEMGTVIGFYSRLAGRTSWRNDQGAWIIIQYNRQPGSDITRKTSYVFLDTPDVGRLLNAVYVDGEQVPQGQLFYLVASIVSPHQ